MARHSHPFEETVTDLAKRLGVGRAHLSEVLNGTARPSGLLAFQIEEATGGAFKAADLIRAHVAPTSPEAA
jgi:transcriptional regulator with XRE-family HTH domain